MWPFRLRPGSGVCALSCAAIAGLAACGGDSAPVGAFPIPDPEAFDRDLDRNQELARKLESGPLGALLVAAERGSPAPLVGALTADFTARFPSIDQARKLPDATLEILELPPDTVEPTGGEEFTSAWLSHVRPWRRRERVTLDIQRLQLAADDADLPPGEAARATGDALFFFGGEYPRGDRCSLRAEVTFEALRSTAGTWRLSRLDLLEGERVRGGPMAFRPVARETGFSYHRSPRNRQLIQSFVDEHRTLALGGLTALDWNKDGYWDLLGTCQDQLSTLFLNDGNGGFVPELLPVDAPHEAASFLLYVDLDGDGSEELVSSAILSYEGAVARCGLYTKGGGYWNLRADTFEFPNPVGLRRLAVQTLVPFDANGDGLLDLFFAVYGSALSRGDEYNSVEAHDGADNHLFINQGDLTFTEESDARGISGEQYTYVATAFDFDGDGDQDLFEGNDFGPNIVWLNDGKGHFTADTELGIAGDSAYSMGATLADYDNTGRWSLYVSNMSSSAGMRMIDLPPDLDGDLRERVRVIVSGNRLFEQQESGPWIERAAEARCDDAGWAWGSIFADFDNDGDQDLFSTNGFTSHANPELPDWQPWFWRQVLDDAAALQAGRPTRDANAHLGLFRGSFNGYEYDRFYHNPDGATGRFIEAGYVQGVDLLSDGRAAVPVDVDGDGDLDLAMWTIQGLELLENRAQPSSFVRIQLGGKGGMAGTLGAQVEVQAGGVTMRQMHRLVEGFQSQVPSDLHFGLGAAERVDRITVRWPSGHEDTWTDVPAGGLVSLRESAASPELRPLPAWPEVSRPRGIQPSVDTFARRIGGGSEPLARLGNPAVLRVAAPEGEPWPDADKLAKAAPNLRMALLVPGEEAERGLGEAPYAAFTLDSGLAGQLFGEGEPVRPATFVFDAEGRLARTFLREVERLELLSTLAALAEESAFPQLLIEAGRRALAEGRFRDGRELFQAAISGDPLLPSAYEGLARAHRLLSRPDLAEESYRRSVQVDPDYSIGHYNLGTALVGRGAFKEAVQSYREALRIHPQARTHMALGEALLLAGDNPGALEAFLAGLERMNPTEVEQRSSALTTIGKVQGKLKRLDEAAQSLEQALELDPLNGDAQRALDLVRQLQSGER